MRQALRKAGTRRIALPVVGGAVVAGLGLYAAGLAAGDIPDGTRVRGIDIGGMSRVDAQRALDRKLSPDFAEPIALKIGDRTEKAAPGTLGLSLDTAAIVERAADPASDPVTVIRRVVASPARDVEPVVRVDEDKTRAAIERIGRSIERPARDGAITFENGAAHASAPVTGTALDQDKALAAVREASLRPATATKEVVLRVKRTQPRIGADETARAMREIARPAMSAPVTLTLGDRHITIAPATLGKHLAMKAGNPGGSAKGNRLAMSLDVHGLMTDPAVAQPLREASQGPREPKFRLDARDRVVVAEEARVGRPVTEKAFGDAVRPLLTRSGKARTGEIAARAIQPQLTSASARELGITEKVSSFTVNFPAAPYRSTNIARAVELIDGSLVMPGKEWSFNRTVGERTPENGFVDGIMINDGRYVKSPGGGVSAVATTMYNAMFFAGVKPLEYGAHSFYIERYPEGREATVAWGTLDLRWSNDSGHALYIQASSTDTSVTITFLGTKKYDEIRATKGPRTRITPPGSREDSGPTCEVQTPLEGFDVSVGRVFVQDGREVKREDYETHYTPRDKVTCTLEESEKPAATQSLPPETSDAPAAPASSDAPAAATGTRAATETSVASPTSVAKEVAAENPEPGVG
ncbi:VanW family protein [Streptomyces sp. SCSIO 30461]|uniref:VanW family protein n=1 Tax=Streptomyces sp. SCSIO 30461 TaxID=3118085 RepID=UPI0030D5496A